MRNFLIILSCLTVLQGTATLVYGGLSDECAATSNDGIAFAQRPEGQRMLSSSELDRMGKMNDSIMCEGNCTKVAERISDYLNTGDLEHLKLPPLSKRLRFKETFFNIEDDDTYWLNQATKAAERSIPVSQPGTLNGMLDALEEGGPGSHAIVCGTLKPTAPISPVSEALTAGYIRFSGGGHAFNLAVIDGENGIAKIVVLDGYSPEKFKKVFGYSSVREYFNDNYDYDEGMAFFPRDTSETSL